MKRIVSILAVVFFPVFAQAQLFTSPRATALGGYTSVSDDVFGLDWNLAGTTFHRDNLEVSFGADDYRYNREFENFRVLMHFKGRHVVAIRRTPGQFLDHALFKTPSLPLDSRSPLDLFHELSYQEDWSVGYAAQLFSNIAFGLDFRRMIYSNTFHSSSRFWSANLNVFYRVNPKLNLAMVARNIASYHYKKNIKSIKDYSKNPPETIPVNFDEFQSVYTKPTFRLDFGAAYHPWSRLLLSLDLYTDGGYGVGYEWEALKNLFVRQGMSHKYDLLFKNEKVFGLSWGLGYKYHNLRLDATYYFPYGGRDAVLETTSFGKFSVDPRKTDKVMISALFSID